MSEAVKAKDLVKINKDEPEIRIRLPKGKYTVHLGIEVNEGSQLVCANSLNGGDPCPGAPKSGLGF